MQNLQKFLQRIQTYEDVQFLGPKWSICPQQNIFWKIISIILIYLSAPFIAQNLKKILPVDPELWYIIFGPKIARFPKWEFFSENLLMSEKSKSDINLLVKYWRLNNPEISLAESHFWL